MCISGNNYQIIDVSKEMQMSNFKTVEINCETCIGKWLSKKLLTFLRYSNTASQPVLKEISQSETQIKGNDDKNGMKLDNFLFLFWKLYSRAVKLCVDIYGSIRFHTCIIKFMYAFNVILLLNLLFRL